MILKEKGNLFNFHNIFRWIYLQCNKHKGCFMLYVVYCFFFSSSLRLEILCTVSNPFVFAENTRWKNPCFFQNWIPWARSNLKSFFFVVFLHLQLAYPWSQHWFGLIRKDELPNYRGQPNEMFCALNSLSRFDSVLVEYSLGNNTKSFLLFILRNFIHKLILSLNRWNIIQSKSDEVLFIIYFLRRPIFKRQTNSKV